MEADEKFQTEVIRRLDILISLLLDHGEVEPNKVSITNKIIRLRDLGTAPAEVARILRKPVNYVTSVLSAQSRRRGTRRGG